jgi:predicted Zn-dependent protease with MMP-like domain
MLDGAVGALPVVIHEVGHVLGLDRDDAEQHPAMARSW